MVDEIAQRIRMTPAEQMVVVEQAQSIKADCDDLIKSMNGSPGDSIAAFSRLGQHVSYLQSLLAAKVEDAARRLSEEQGGLR